MPISTYEQPGGHYAWSWTDAFDQASYDQGGPEPDVWLVAQVLKNAGYDVVVEQFELHHIITYVKRDGVELIPKRVRNNDEFFINPRTYLPKETIALLDAKLPDVEVTQ